MEKLLTFLYNNPESALLDAYPNLKHYLQVSRDVEKEKMAAIIARNKLKSMTKEREQVRAIARAVFAISEEMYPSIEKWLQNVYSEQKLKTYCMPSW